MEIKFRRRQNRIKVLLCDLKPIFKFTMFEKSQDSFASVFPMPCFAFPSPHFTCIKPTLSLTSP